VSTFDRIVLTDVLISTAAAGLVVDDDQTSVRRAVETVSLAAQGERASVAEFDLNRIAA